MTLDTTTVITLDFYGTTATLENITQADAIADERRNLAVVGDEIIQFLTATQVAGFPNRWELRDLYREKFGTPRETGSMAGKRFVLLDDAIQFVPMEISDLNTTLQYKGVSSGQSLGDAATIEFAWTGRGLKPYPPVNLTGKRNVIGDLEIAWLARAREGGIRSYFGLPLVDQDEMFIVEIYSGSTLKRQMRVPVRRQTSEFLQWGFFSTPSGGLGTNPSFDEQGTVTFTGFQNVMRATRFFSANTDFILQFSAHPSNALLPHNVMVQGRGTELQSIRPLLAIVRPNGNTNAQASVSDGDFAYNIDLTYPNKVYFSRVKGEMKVYLNDISPSAVAYAVSSQDYSTELSLITLMQAAGENAILYQPSIAFVDTPRWTYTANMQAEDFGSAQASITVRVMEESRLVGPGPYTEAVL